MLRVFLAHSISVAARPQGFPYADGRHGGVPPAASGWHSPPALSQVVHRKSFHSLPVNSGFSQPSVTHSSQLNLLFFQREKTKDCKFLASVASSYHKLLNPVPCYVEKNWFSFVVFNFTQFLILLNAHLVPVLTVWRSWCWVSPAVVAWQYLKW